MNVYHGRLGKNHLNGVHLIFSLMNVLSQFHDPAGLEKLIKTQLYDFENIVHRSE